MTSARSGFRPPFSKVSTLRVFDLIACLEGQRDEHNLRPQQSGIPGPKGVSVTDSGVIPCETEDGAPVQSDDGDRRALVVESLGELPMHAWAEQDSV